MNLQVSDVYLSPNGRDGTYSRVNASYDHSSVHEVGYQSDLSGLDLTSLGLGFAIAVFTFSVIFLVLLSRFQIQPRSPRKGSTKKSDSKNEIIDDSDIPDNSIINTYSEIREEDENIKLKNLFKNEIEELKNEIEELKKTQTNKIENEVQRLFSNYRSSLGSTNELHSDVSYSEDKDGSHQRLDKSNNSEMRQPVNNRINDEIQILVKDYCCAEISDYSKVREDFLYKYKQEYRGRFYNFGLNVTVTQHDTEAPDIWQSANMGTAEVGEPTNLETILRAAFTVEDNFTLEEDIKFIILSVEENFTELEVLPTYPNGSYFVFTQVGSHIVRFVVEDEFGHRSPVMQVMLMVV